MMSDDFSSLKNFDGMVRLFPLPNVVLFPFVIQKLHIFEPRYRQMTADALASDRLITMVLLKPGWESSYEGRPALYPVACVGRIVADQQLPDGRYDIQLRGLARAHIKQEVGNGKMYRRAQVELLPDIGTPSSKTEDALRRLLLQAVPGWCREHPPAAEALSKLVKSTMPLGAVTDIISYVLPLAVEFKQEQLENPHVGERVRQLLHYLQTKKSPGPPAGDERKFPPDFSNN